MTIAAIKPVIMPCTVGALLAIAAFSVPAAEPPQPVGDLAKVDRHMAVKTVSVKGVAWHDPARAPFRIGGLNWFRTNGLYRRLPVMDGIPQAVNKLAHCTTGVTITFRTDSNRVLVHGKEAQTR